MEQLNKSDWHCGRNAAALNQKWTFVPASVRTIFDVIHDTLKCVQQITMSRKINSRLEQLRRSCTSCMHARNFRGNTDHPFMEYPQLYAKPVISYNERAYGNAKILIGREP